MMDAIESNVMEKPADNDTPKAKKPNARHCPRANSSTPVPQEANKALDNILKQIETLKELVLNTPNVDIEKIQFLKKEIMQGRYKIFSKEIAAKLFAEVE